MINFTFGNNDFQTVAGSEGFCLGRTGFLAAVRDIETIAIPGGNMVLTRDNGGWKTTSGKYQCFIQSGYGEKIQAVQEWLSQIGFQRLEDTEEPDYYRMAIFRGPIDEKRVLHNDIGRFDINFECKAGKWLKSGENEISVLKNGTIVNPTAFPSKPLIVVSGTGAGVLTINGNTINISDIGNSVTIDSATERAYNGNEARDDTISGPCFELASGNNTVTWSGGVVLVKITPRWWTL